MARVKFIGIRETLTSLLPKAELQRMARESGAMRRRRKVDPSAMFWCVVLGFGTGAERTLAGLRRSYERATGKSLVPSSFYDRFTPGLARMFRAVLAQLMKKLASSDVRYGGVLEGFRDVLAADATVIKLRRLLARRFPGTRTNSSPAAAKLHLVMSVRGGWGTQGQGDGRACERPPYDADGAMGCRAVVALRPRLLSISTL